MSELHRWTDREGQEWACAEYDHGPFCRGCHKVDATDRALLAEVERLRTALAGLYYAVDDTRLHDVPIVVFRAHAAMAAAREALGTTGNEGA